jgi:4-hydroxybenzoate polyprenyltransferase
MSLLQGAVRVFECPSCKETINTSISRCPYCSTEIDPQAADAAAGLTSRVSQACNDASYIRIVAGCLVGFFLLTLVPFMGLVGIGGYYVLLVLVPILTIRWLVRFASLRSDDSDYRRAKRNVGIALAIWAAFVLFTSVRLVLR